MGHVSEATKTFDLSGGNLCLDFANTARHVGASRARAIANAWWLRCFPASARATRQRRA
jgi:hypothetical protein